MFICITEKVDFKHNKKIINFIIMTFYATRFWENNWLRFSVVKYICTAHFGWRGSNYTNNNGKWPRLTIDGQRPECH